jgi:hypothetical protein
MRYVLPCGGWLLLSAAPALAAPYWIDYEADNPEQHFPEQEGWTRIWGNWEGQFHGSGAVRTLHDGTLTYDSLYDDGVYDFSQMVRPGQMDPHGQEVFVCEWRLRVDEVHGFMDPGDPGLALTSDEAWVLGFEFARDHIYSVFENYLEIPFTPGVFHDYRLLSPDMRVYTLYIDGVIAHEGALMPRFGTPRIGWGDSVEGAASLHDWDYFRFGAVLVPESNTLSLLLLSACCVHRRCQFHRPAHEEKWPCPDE